MEPEWLQVARKYVGLKEAPGAATNSTIAGWLIRLKAWWNDDEQPWCGTYVAACFAECDIPIAKHWYRARDWLNWGIPLDFPTVGAVVIFSREGGGHVGFVVGQDTEGNLMTLGGNQSNRVSIVPFNRGRVLGFRWPPVTVVAITDLPVVDSNGRVSANEA